MAALAVAAPSAVPFEFENHKRRLSAAADGIRSLRPRQRVQALDETPDTSMPSSSSRPTQQVNTRIPIARACSEEIVPCHVGFVSRGPVTTATTLEALNEILAADENVVDLRTADPLLGMFATARAESLYQNNDPKTDARKLKHQRARRFSVKKMLKNAGRFGHPVDEYALDGIVATAPDREPVGRLGSVCTVAVGGPCPFALRVLHGSAPNPTTWVANPAIFVGKKPVVLERVYVCLVALRSTPQETRWRFRYEVVFESGLPAFDRSTGPLKFLLRTQDLGRVTDSNFGTQAQPAVVVTVGVRSTEPLDADGNAVDNTQVVRTLLLRGRDRRRVPLRTPRARDFPVESRVLARRRNRLPVAGTGAHAFLDEDSDLDF